MVQHDLHMIVHMEMVDAICKHIVHHSDAASEYLRNLSRKKDQNSFEIYTCRNNCLVLACSLHW